MALGEIATGLAALKSALDILKGAKDLRGVPATLDLQSLQSAIIDAQQGLIAANEAQAKYLDENRALKIEIQKLSERRANLDRYELRDLGHGSFAYMLKRDSRGTEPAHWACTKCFGDGEIRILMDLRPRSGPGRLAPTCPACFTPIEPANHVPKWLD
jgi:hypothetical protein